MKNIFVFSFICLLVFFGCEYDKEEPGDTEPPSKVHLTPHLGDAGDVVEGDTLTDENNGIDAEPGGDVNNIKIQWDNPDEYPPNPLVLDGDICKIELYRFEEGESENPTLVKTEDDFDPNSPPTRVIDDELSDNDDPYQKWYYYIIPYDEAGNFTKSDTVSYQLLSKPNIESPEDNTVENINVIISFKISPIQDATDYRVLFFYEDGSVQYFKTFYNLECELVPENCGLQDTTYYWRIDAFGFWQSGSESEERQITFISK